MSNAFDLEARRIERELAERLTREAPAIRRGLEALAGTMVESFVQAGRSAERLQDGTRNAMRPAGRP